jgi:acrylyl-CoA reductase (NADPH)
MRDLPLEKLDRMTEILPLSSLPEFAPKILAGAVRGRIVLDVNA